MLKITPAAPTEADTLTAIALAAKAHWGYPVHWLARWRPLLTITPAFVAAHETYVARLAGEEHPMAAGFYSLCRGGAHLHLEHLWVRPEAMGRGVGRALFGHARQRARALGFACLEIEADPHAAGFYVHLGAERVGSRPAWMDGQRRELPLFRCHACDQEHHHAEPGGWSEA